MKKALIAIAALLISVSAYAQGQVNFRTHIAAEGIDAKILNPDNSPAVGAFAQLVAVGAGGALTPMTEAPATVNAAGYVTAGAATFQGFAAGSTANLILRAWQGAAGSTYDAASIKIASAPFSVTFATPPNPPGDLLGVGGNLALPTSVPEPTTLALGALSLGALALYRRKKA